MGTRRIMLLLLLLFVAMSQAADTTDVAIWQVTADTPGQSFLRKGDNLTRSIALNPVNSHLLVATRTSGERIVVLEASTGDSLSQLDMTGVSGGTAAINKVAVTADGVVYACNLNTSNGFKIYRWQDENAVPVCVADTAITGAIRYGDAFAVYGQGLDTKLFISGNNDKSWLTVLGTANGVKFRVERILEKNGRATDICPLEVEKFWLKYPGNAATLMDTTGSILRQIPVDAIPDAASALQWFRFNGKEYLAAFDGASTPTGGRLVEIMGSDEPPIVHLIFNKLGLNPNINATGAITVQLDSDRIFLLSTNNSISAFAFTSVLIWPCNWRIFAEDSIWFGTESAVLDIAYSSLTRHLYVPTLKNGSAIKVIRAESGDYVKEIPWTGIDSMNFQIHALSVSDDGQLFASNLSLPGATFMIYRWHDEDSMPELVFQQVADERLGDAFIATGSGLSVQLHTSGRGGSKIQVLTTSDGLTWRQGYEIPTSVPGAAGRGISRVGLSDYYILNGDDGVVRYLYVDGTELFQFSPTEFKSVSSTYFEVNTMTGKRKFIAGASGPYPGTQVVELLGEEGDNLCSSFSFIPSRTTVYAAAANPEQIMSIVFDPANRQIVELCGNNGVAAYSILRIVPESLSKNGTISGHVYSIDSRSPIEKAVVKLVDKGLAKLTDASGVYSFPDLPPGDYVISASALPHFVQVIDTVSLLDAQQLQQDFFLPSIPGFETRYRPIIQKVVPYGSAAKVVFNYPRSAVSLRSWGGSSLGFSPPAKLRHGYGAIFDLTSYPNYSIEQLDFVHLEAGTVLEHFFFRVHVYDWSQKVEMYTSDQYTANNWSIYKTEVAAAVDLGGLPWMAQVGVFIEPLTGEIGDAYPRLPCDNTLPGSGSSQVITDIDDPFKTAMDADLYFSRPTRFPFDLWLNPPASVDAFAADIHDPKSKNQVLSSRPSDPIVNTLQAFKFYRLQDDNLDPEYIGVKGINEGPFIDETVLADSNYWYGVSACYDSSETQLDFFKYHQPKLSSLAEAIADMNKDFVPDHLGEFVQVRGVVNSINYEVGGKILLAIQDENAGLWCRLNGPFEFQQQLGDEIYAYGAIEQTQGLTRLRITDQAVVRLIQKGVEFPVKSITKQGLNESVEGMLVSIRGFKLVNLSSWPQKDHDAIVKITNGPDMIDVFIDKETDIDGSAPPTEFFTLTGVVDQASDKTPGNDGYRICPRGIQDFAITVDVQNKRDPLPVRFALHQNHPNPFNPNTTIQLDVPEPGNFRIIVYDIRGREVDRLCDQRLLPGRHQFNLHNNDLPSGLYVYRVESEKFTTSKRMVLIK